MCHGIDEEAFLKINEILDCNNITDGVVLVKFCDNIEELKEFELFNFDNSEVAESVRQKYQSKMKSSVVSHVLFMIKMDSISCSITTNPQDYIRSVLRSNTNVSKMWHVTVLYVRRNFNKKMLQIDLF